MALSASLACVTFVGCSSQNPGGACNPCAPAAGDGAAPPAITVNPDGIPYPNPSGGYGRTARSGNTPGSVMQNYQFQGYLDGNISSGLQTIALANYYDPCGKRYKMLHIAVAAFWCTPCQMETAAFVAAKADLASKGVVFLQALSDGPLEGVGATVSDLDHWIEDWKSNFTEVLDPGLMNFGGYFPASAVPFNFDVDPRTMELLDRSDGFGTTAMPGTVDGEIQPGLTALPATPGYPIPAACGDN